MDSLEYEIIKSLQEYKRFAYNSIKVKVIYTCMKTEFAACMCWNKKN